MPIYQNLYQTLLPCPIVELRGYPAAYGLGGGSIPIWTSTAPPARPATAWPRGCWLWRTQSWALKPGQPVIEAFSGALAPALTLAGLTAGHPVVLVMPEDARLCGRTACCVWEPRSSTAPPGRAFRGPCAWPGRPPPPKAGTTRTGWPTTSDPEYHRRVTGPAIVQSIAGRVPASWTPSPSGWAAPAP